MRFTPQPSRSWLSLVLIMCVSSISHIMDQVSTDFHSQWSPVMYSVIDSDFYISCLFFITCIVVLNFWIINLFVAVITNSFAAIRSETRKSAFGATSYDLVPFLFGQNLTFTPQHHFFSRQRQRRWLGNCRGSKGRTI